MPNQTYPVARHALVLAVFAALACGGKDAAAPGKTDPLVPDPRAVTLSIDVSADRHPISPLIYGSNQDDGTSTWTIRRYGGNRLTGYNWENNFSNAGSDYLHQSDDYLIWVAGLPASDARIPARAVTHFHDQSLAIGAQSIVTLQIAGYVAADGNGPVSAAEAAPSSRWVRVAPKKNAPFATTPDTTDGVVYMDELVNLLVQKYGSASSPDGVKWYSLDNEPALWSSTHPRIHPDKLGAQELADKSIALASAVKDVDPATKILGPAAYGFTEYLTLQDAPDWPTVKGSSARFLDWYFRLYRNYDGQSGTFGATGVRALTSDTARVSVFASIDDADASVLHVVARPSATELAITVPKLSATHLVLRATP